MSTVLLSVAHELREMSAKFPLRKHKEILDIIEQMALDLHDEANPQMFVLEMFAELSCTVCREFDGSRCSVAETGSSCALVRLQMV